MNREALMFRAMQPQVGDTYTRADGRITVEVIRVIKTHIDINFTEAGRTEPYQHKIDDFKRLAQKSIESGGRFIPAVKAKESSAAESKTDSTAIHPPAHFPFKLCPHKHRYFLPSDVVMKCPACGAGGGMQFETRAERAEFIRTGRMPGIEVSTKGT